MYNMVLITKNNANTALFFLFKNFKVGDILNVIRFF